MVLRFSSRKLVVKLFPTVVIVLAGAVQTRRLIRNPSASWAFLTGVAFATIAMLVYLTLAAPNYGVKAFYGSAAIVPLCILAALGFEGVCRIGRWASVVSAILLGVWCMNSYAAYWIRPGSSETQRFVALTHIVQGETEAGAGILERALAQNPDDLLNAHLANLRITFGQCEEAADCSIFPFRRFCPALHQGLLKEVRKCKNHPEGAVAE